MGRDDLEGCERFATMRGRVANMAEVDALVGGWTATMARDAVFDSLIAHRVPCAPVRGLAEVMADRHLHERGMLLEIEHPGYGTVTVCRSPLRFAGHGQAEYRPSPDYGADNDAVYGGILGLDRAQLAALAGEGVI